MLSDLLRLSVVSMPGTMLSTKPFTGRGCSQSALKNDISPAYQCGITRVLAALATGAIALSAQPSMCAAQYLAPWTHFPTDKSSAMRALSDQLQQQGAVNITTNTDSGTITADVPFTSPWGKPNTDQLTFIFKDGGIVVFSSNSVANSPDPPFCLTPGCISGPGNRGRLEALRDQLGWSNLETDEDKKWVQIMLH